MKLCGKTPIHAAVVAERSSLVSKWTIGIERGARGKRGARFASKRTALDDRLNRELRSKGISTFSRHACSRKTATCKRGLTGSLGLAPKWRGCFTQEVLVIHASELFTNTRSGMVALSNTCAGAFA